MRRITSVACLLFCILAQQAIATEPVLEFVEGLRELRYFDTALYYLDQVSSRKDLPAEVRQVLPYERGQTLLQSAKDLTNLDAQRKQLDAAQASFEDFVKAQPDHPLAARANSARGQILLEKARVDIWDGDKPSNHGNQENLRKTARTAISSARKIFEQARDQHKKAWEKFPTFIPEDQKEAREKRDEAEESYIRAQLDIAQCTYWEAQSHDKGTKERKDLLNKAAFEFEAIHQQYRSQIGGLYARIWQGKCFEEQGGADGIRIALGIYGEILEHEGSSPTMRSLKDRALRFRLICLNYPERHDYQLVIQEAEAWLRDAKDRSRTDVGLGIQWELCRAQETLGMDRNVAEAQRKNLLTQALNRARSINRYPGELKTPSSAMVQRLLLALNRDPTDPKDFDTAYGSGGQLFDQVAATNSAISKLVAEGKSKEALQEKEAMGATAAEMTRMYDLALRLATPANDQVMVNIARLRMSYGYLLQERFFDAAVVADEQMIRYGEKYPEVAREAGFLAMTAYDHAYSHQKEGQRQFEARKVIEAANKICERWPDSDRANDARNAVAKIYWNDGDLVTAAQWWEKIPKGTPQYPDAQVRAGKAFWRQYVLGASKPEGERPSPEELNKWKQSAISHLVTGLNEAEKTIPANTPLSDDLVGAKLTLVNIRNLDGLYQAKDAKSPPGALDLLMKEPHPVLKAVAVPEGQARPKDPGKAKSRQMASFAYQQLLRAWVGMRNLDEARKARAELEKVAAGGDEAALTQVFVEFGRELEQELERLKASNDTKRLNDVRAGFESFLNDLFQRKDGQTFYSLLWIAETFTSLAEGSSDNAEKAQSFYNKASTAYESILTAAANDPNFANPQQLLACKLRLVNCLRRQKDFPKAETIMVEILKSNPNAPDAQFEAAQLYQSWAMNNPDDPAPKFDVALYGEKTPVHIWGWTYTAQSLQQALYRQADERLEKLHFDARYNMASAEKDYGLAAKDPKVGKQHLERAKSAIAAFQRISKRWPDDEYARFNALYKDVLTQLGEPVLDLPRDLSTTERKQPQVAEASQSTPAAEKTVQPVAATATPAAPKSGSKSNMLLMLVVLVVGACAVVGLFFLSAAQNKKKKPARSAAAMTGAGAGASSASDDTEMPVFEGFSIAAKEHEQEEVRPFLIEGSAKRPAAGKPDAAGPAVAKPRAAKAAVAKPAVAKSAATKPAAAKPAAATGAGTAKPGVKPVAAKPATGAKPVAAKPATPPAAKPAAPKPGAQARSPVAGTPKPQAPGEAKPASPRPRPKPPENS